jgi:hypothetical protein
MRIRDLIDIFYNMIKRAMLLFTVLVLVTISSATYLNKTFAISFTNGPCPRGEARDYMGICFPVKECKASLFAAPGTCKEFEGTVTKGEGGKVTITAPNYKGSPVHLPGGGIIKKGWCTLYPMANNLLNKLSPGAGGQGGEKETCAETK